MQESTQKNEQGDFWPKSDVSYDQLQKFWNGLTRKGRQEILEVDKQTFLEQARKSMVCSRCYGILVDEFSRIIVFGNSTQQDETVDQDPSKHPWGCLTATRDGTQKLTLLDHYFSSTSLKGIQKVFDNARAIERERKLFYPSSCGVGGRRWKGPGTKECCSVHTIRLPVEKLVELWSSQREESRQYLFKMKEEDFIERLTFRFDDKKICRDCRKNIFREFRELKELTSTQKESGFQYEISHDTVQADWSQTFTHTYGSYRHFEWGIGTAKGKSDISAFKNVGLSEIVQVNGLHLSGLDACYITLRAWKTDGECTELSVRARTSMGPQYVHCSLVVGEGFVTITEGESMGNIFKRAEAIVREDNLMDENGNRLNGACSHSKKDAKSPELARKFLLDAATVLFKEQVEKAFREKRARQNVHRVFVSLALNMLEERAHISCKELLTLKNQIKFLEEEEKEKNEEEARKERRRIKEREKKLRRKERTKEKETKGDNSSLTKQQLAPEVTIEESTIVNEEPDATETVNVTSSRPVSPHIQDEQKINEYMRKNMHNSSDVIPDEDFASSNNKNGSSGSDRLKHSGWKLKNRYHQDTTSKSSINKQFTVVPRSGTMVNKSEKRYHDDHFDSSSRTANTQNKHSRKANSIIRAGDVSEPPNFGKKFTQGDHIHDSCGRPKLTFVAGNIPSSRDSPQTKEVGQPMELQMKYIRSHSESDVAVKSSTLSGDATEPYKSLKTHGALCKKVGGQKTVGVKDKDDVKKELKSCKPGMRNNGHNGFHPNKETCQHSKEVVRVTSSSDNVSSCLSKGNNSCPSSNSLVIEPLPTSNSEYASQQSDGIDGPRRLQIGVRECEEVMMDKKKIANRGEPISSCLLDGIRIHTPGKVSKENGNGNPDVSQMYLEAQGIPGKQEPMQKQPYAAGEQNLNSKISQAEDKGFSFFHFDTPSGLADAYKSNSLPSKDIVGGHSLVKFIHHNEGDLASNKRDSFKEYNLFATGKGITFSIFSK